MEGQLDSADLEAALRHRLATQRPVFSLARALEALLNQLGQHGAHYQMVKLAVDSLEDTTDRDLRMELGKLAHLLGRGVAQHRRRYTEAETNYKEALDLYIEFNYRHSQARTDSQLGILHREWDRSAEGVPYSLAALSYRTEHDPEATGIDLRTLRRQRSAVGHDEFRRIVTEHVGRDQSEELIERVARVPEPEGD